MAERRTDRVALIGRVLGPAVAIAVLLLPAGGVSALGQRVAALVLWMAVWWVTEAVPVAVTSLLPLVVLPLAGVRSVREVAPNYGNHMIFLFLGGFVLALAVQHSGLHRRLALATLAMLGTSTRRLVWGFLAITAVLSMWLSNTATTLMMLPIAAGVAQRLDVGRARYRLLLGVAYGASIGGVGTLIGTPPNLVLAGMAPKVVPGLEQLSFGGWMLFGLPLVACMIPVAGVWLGRGLGGAAAPTDMIVKERDELGRISPAERRAAVLFGATAVAWITRAGFDIGSISIPGWSALLPDPGLVTDAVPAVAAAILATMIPAGTRGRSVLVSWSEVRSGVAWGVLLLFGGGFALADAVRVTGLDTVVANWLHGLSAFPLVLVIAGICTTATLATELTSNTATATLLVPVVAAVAAVVGVPPYLVLAPAIVACSFAFMLPVATPPNAIVIGSGYVSARDLLREGMLMNVAGVVVATLLALTLGRLVLPLS